MRKIVQISASSDGIFALTADGDVLVADSSQAKIGRPLRWVSIYSSGVTDGDSLHQGIPNRDSSVEVPASTVRAAEHWATRCNVGNALR